MLCMFSFACSLYTLDLNKKGEHDGRQRKTPLFTFWLQQEGKTCFVHSALNHGGTRRMTVDESEINKCFNLSKPTGYVLHQQFNIQQL